MNHMSRRARARARAGSRTRWGVSFLAGLLLTPLAVSAVARADTPPSVWDRAKDPTIAESYRVHVEVQRRLTGVERFEVGDAQLRTVRTLLERYNADKSHDPRLRFDLGLVYLKLNEHEKSARTLKSVLADFPDHPAAEDGWLRLAFACGHTGDHECERNAYTQVLRYATEEIARATPTLNLAETEMHLGHLREAVEGYREALRIAGRVPSRETAPLAVWGLAVALDRSGDRLAAEKEARFARELARSMGVPHLLRTDGVFFVPAYEVNWYEGLGSSAAAKVATSPNEALRLWRSAEQSFTGYVRGAQVAGNDRWLDLAKLRLATVRAERERAEKKQVKEPHPDLDDGDTTL
jgi:tetratricopeptide (TPR) repeat protein